MRRTSGLTTVMLAGAPTSSSHPWSLRRPMLAGAEDMARAMSRQVMRPVLTIVSIRTLRAVSRPVMPKAPACHSQSLSSNGWGAWSVPTTSMVPSARAWRTASTSSAVRSGGLTL